MHLAAFFRALAARSSALAATIGIVLLAFRGAGVTNADAGEAQCDAVRRMRCAQDRARAARNQAVATSVASASCPIVRSNVRSIGQIVRVGPWSRVKRFLRPWRRCITG
ncbi:MAG: hypothetical protein AcusKO_02410 [Acuticoccus sp.]